MRKSILSNETHPANPRNSVRGLCGLAVCMTLCVLGSRNPLHAECGGYVTIGNQAKADELRAAGFDVDGRMAGTHSRVPQAKNSTVVPQPKRARFGILGGGWFLHSRDRHRTSDDLATEQYAASLAAETHEVGSTLELVAASNESSPMKQPCSGPSCRSSGNSFPLPTPVAVSIVPVEAGMVSGDEAVFGRESSYLGILFWDESPFYFAVNLDRPPE